MAGRTAALRASDKDRDRVADRLREAASEGRLMIEELEHRLGTALRARTYGELEALIADLPGPRLLARPRRRRRLRVMPALGLIVGVVLIAPLVIASLALMVQLALGVLLVSWIWAGVAWLFFGRAVHRRRAMYWHRAAYWRRPVPGLGPHAWSAEWQPRRRA